MLRPLAGSGQRAGGLARQMRLFPLPPWSLLSLLPMLGCDGSGPDTSKPDADDSADDSGTGPDADGDGVPDSADCAPDDPYAYPGAREVPYDGVDQDCDGADINDVDGDGFIGAAGGGDDCNDSNPTVHPGAEEVCYNGIDDDCSGVEELPDDCDGDGATRLEDCDDQDPAIHPGAEDIWYDGVDQDCDTADDYDQDVDGEQWSGIGGVDCNDEDPAINTDATEIWDGRDNDCDGTTDHIVSYYATSRWQGSALDLDGGFGSGWALLGDTDGDSVQEVAITAPSSDEGLGQVWVLPVQEGVVLQTSALAQIKGDMDNSYLGYSILLLNDQLILGSAGAGAVYQIERLSGAGLIGIADADALFESSSGAATLTALSDETGDGVEDFTAFTPAGTQISLLNGDTFAEHWVGSSEDPLDTCGAADDLDGDGMSELFVQTTTRTSRLAIVDSATLSAGGTTALGDLPHISVSDGISAISSLPDLDGDGYGDMLISVSGNADGAGQIFLISGLPPDGAAEDAAQATITGSTVDSRARAASMTGVTGIDHDLDGVPDVTVCEPGEVETGFTARCLWIAGADLRAGGSYTAAPGSPMFEDYLSDNLFGSTSAVHDADSDGDGDLWINSLGTTGGLFLFRQER